MKAKCNKAHCKRIAVYHVLDKGENYCEEHISIEDKERQDMIAYSKEGFEYI